MKKKWQCFECGKIFKLKRDLVEHLKDEFEEANIICDEVAGQLEELGVKEPWK